MLPSHPLVWEMLSGRHPPFRRHCKATAQTRPVRIASLNQGVVSAARLKTLPPPFENKLVSESLTRGALYHKLHGRPLPAHLLLTDDLSTLQIFDGQDPAYDDPLLSSV